MALVTDIMSDGEDIGGGVKIKFTSWHEYDHAGLIESHKRPDNDQECWGSVMFDLPGVKEAFPDRELWTLVSLEPLHIEPSILCTACGKHGYIRNGRWEGV